MTPPDPAVLADELHTHLLADDPAALGRPEVIAGLVERAVPLAAPDVVADIVQRVTDRSRGLGPVEALLRDPTITDIVIDGPGPIVVDGPDGLTDSGVHIDRAALDRAIERLASGAGRRVDLHHPLVDLRTADGSRAHVVLPPIAPDGPCLTIRRFPVRELALDAFTDAPEVASLLTNAVVGRANIVVSGGTGAGKTALLRTLLGLLPPSTRVVTAEDAAELAVTLPRAVRLETRPATPDGLAAVTLRDLVRNALRMRPDRIVVGEVRGGECLDMLWAMNTGHEGSMSTCHANSPADAVRRLETMALAAPERLSTTAVASQIHAAVDLVVHVQRRADGTRWVRHVDELTERPADPPTRRLVGDGRVVAGPERTR